MKNIHPVVLILFCLVLAGCDSLQTTVKKGGFIPLSDLDLVQIVPPEGGKVYSDQVVIGSIYPWPEDKDGFLVGDAFHPVPLPPRPTYSFSIALSRGPDEVLKSANADASLTVDKLNLGSWSPKLNFQFSAAAKGQFKLNKIWQGAIKTNLDDLVPLFVSADPPSQSPATFRYLWVTGFLAADLDNFAELSGTIKADVQLKTPTTASSSTQPTTYPAPIQLDAGGKADIKGPGLLLGLKGLVVTLKALGTMDDLPLPNVGQPTMKVPIHLADGTVAKFVIYRAKQDEAHVDITNAADTTVYVKDGNDNWKKDSPKAPALAVLPISPRVAFDLSGDSLTRAVILQRRGFGQETTVYSIVIDPTKSKQPVFSCAVYRLSLGETRIR